MIIFNQVKIYYDNLPIFDLAGISLYGIEYVKKNFFINSSIEFEGPYEMNEVRLKNNDYVIDAGANIGIFSLEASRKIGENGKVYAFEPNKKTFNLFSTYAVDLQLAYISYFFVAELASLKQSSLQK